MGCYQEHRCYQGIPLGFAVRRSIAKTTTYRVRRGNGVMGAILGKAYQDKYAYVVPSSINNPEGQHSRDVFAQAVTNWKTILTDDQKKYWNSKAVGRHMSGINLYVQDYMKRNV